VGIYPPSLKNPIFFTPLDARTIGICLWHEFKEGRPFEKTFDIWTQDRWIDVKAEPDGILHLVLDRAASGQSGPLHLWIDEKRGHTPIRLHCQDAPTGGRRPEPPWFVSTASWRQVSGAWVPSTYHIQKQENGGLLLSYDLTFDWISVNRGVEPGLLTAQGLDAPEGTTISDFRGDKPIRVGKVVKPAPLPEPK
jgi:hypothetical protein